LHDIAVLTGGKVATEDSMGPKVEEMKFTDLGQCGKITITKEATTILDGFGKRDHINKRMTFIRKQIEQAKRLPEKERLEERLGKLSQGVAIIRVGGTNQVEMNNRKDRLNDALNATKAAIDQGIVVGGGIALLYSSLILNNV